MRLARGGREADSIAVIHSALDGGVRLLDTADAYAESPSLPHDNERLVAHALASWSGPRDEVVVATKGGLRREGAAWFPDGRAKHLVAAAEASAESLGGRPLDLWQWHAVDPRVPEATSLRAVATIAARGLARAVGLCNVTMPTLQRALDAFPVASVQVGLGFGDDQAVRSGVVAAALGRGALVLAHTPLGGARRVAAIARHPVVSAIARRLGLSPVETFLAWLAHLHPRLVALPGPTRPESARSCARAAHLELAAVDRDALDAAFPRLAGLRAGGGTPRDEPLPVVAARAEIVVLIGSPAAGKSTAVRELARPGDVVLERDEIGGSLDGICARAERELEGGSARVLLDATWPTRAARRAIFEVAARRGAAVRAVWIDTPTEDAQINACRRLVRKLGRLPDASELPRLGKADPRAFGPRALFAFKRSFEPPSSDEGFSTIERRPFLRAEVGGEVAVGAVLVDLDSALWASRSGARAPLDADDLVVDASVAGALARMAAAGARLWGTTWQPRVAAGEMTRADVDALAAALRERHALAIDVRLCAHAPGPPICWCRKPLPGLAVELLETSGIPAASVLAVGATALDRTAAARLGMRHADVAGLLASAGGPADAPPSPGARGRGTRER